jgi:hypothetical protein
MYSATSTRSRISSLNPALPALWNECKQGLTTWKSRSNYLLSALAPAKCSFLDLLFMRFECLISLICLASLVVSFYVLCLQFNSQFERVRVAERRNPNMPRGHVASLLWWPSVNLRCSFKFSLNLNSGAVLSLQRSPSWFLELLLRTIAACMRS